jgi:hypothetical protein
VEDEESLKSSAVVGKLSDSFENPFDEFFSNGIVSTSVIVGGILFSGD